ncbi:MAG: hypothetical protein BRD50_07405, partial [Bacteroidetes bacterium SW_11_45_7]
MRPTSFIPAHTQDNVFLKLFVIGTFLCTISLATSSQNPNDATIPNIGGDTIVCEGEVVSYSENILSGNPDDCFLEWDVQNGVIQQQFATEVDILWPNAGSGKVYLTIKDSTGAVKNEDSVAVTIVATPDPIINTDFRTVCKKPIRSEYVDPNDSFVDDSCWVVCDSSTVTYTAPLNGGSSYDWIVNGARSYTENGNQVTVHWGDVGSGLVKVIETDSNGCEGEAKLCLEVIESPDAGFTTQPSATAGTLNVCKEQTVYFFDQSGVKDVFWDFGDGNTSALRNPKHTYDDAGTFHVNQIVTNECGCKDTSQITVVVDPLVAPDITCISTICENDTATYTTSADCNNYNWSATGGTIIHGQNRSSVTVDWGAPSAGYGVITLEAECD